MELAVVPTKARLTQFMSFFANPILAIGFGAFLLCAETCLHIESLLALPGSWLSLPIHDWVAGCFLLYGGVRSQREWSTGRLYQLAAWAFNASLLCGAFLGHLEDWSAGTLAEGSIPERALVIIIGFLFAISLCALVSTMTVTSRWRANTPA
jgi:hypothetical protein